MTDKPLNRIRELREARGWTLQDLADRVEPKTSNQQIDRLEKGQRRLTVDWMGRISAALGVRPADLINDEDKPHKPPLFDTVPVLGLAATFGVNPGRVSEVRLRAPEAAPAGTLVPRHIHQVMVLGEVQAGSWREAYQWPEDDCYPISFPSSRYDHLPQFALVVRGHSMDLVYPDGTILICVPFTALNRQPQNGERVIVERHHRGLVEATVKELEIGADGRAMLWPRSSRPQFQQPVEMPDQGPAYGLSEGPVTYCQSGLAEHEDDEIRVTALVIASLRFETP